MACKDLNYPNPGKYKHLKSDKVLCNKKLTIHYISTNRKGRFTQVGGIAKKLEMVTQWSEIRNYFYICL